jgi:hypothetical protein
MAEATANNKVDMSATALEIAKSTGFGSDEAKFKEFEKEFIRKFYEVIGLSDIPDEFLTFSKFLDAYSGVLVKSVQNDIAIINLTKRLSMFKLSESINATSDKPAMGEPTPPPQEDKAPGFDPLAK